MKGFTMLKKIVEELTRDQLIGVLSDESAVPTETLRALTFVGLGGNPEDLAAGSNGAAEHADLTTVLKPKPKAPKKAARALDDPNGRSASASVLDAAIEAFREAKAGFAVSDLVELSGGEAAGVTKGKASTAIKRAVKDGRLFPYGEKRFARYGGTLAIAKAASEGSH
jgi:hypothetical protein